MEDLVRSPAPELQTLNPRMEGFSCSPSRAARRSHLDSASYRTLVRIFTLCLDESLARPQESRKDPNPISDEVPGSSCTGKDSIFGRNGDGNVAEEIGRGRREGRSRFEGGESGGFGGSETTQGSACRNPRFDDSSLNGNIGSREKPGHENGTSVELAEAPVFEKLQSGGTEDEALHRMEELGHGSGREECDRSAIGGNQKGLFLTDLEHLLHENINSVEQLGNGEFLNDIISDFSGLIDHPNDLVCSEGSQDGQRRSGHDRIANNELQKDVPLRNAKLADSKNQISCSERGKNHKPQDESSKMIFSGDEMIYSSEELLHGKMRVEGHGECVDDVLTKDMLPDKHMMDEVRDKEIKLVKELGEVLQQEAHCCPDSLMEGSGSRRLASPVLASEDNGDFEEGEIPGALNISDQDLDLVHEHAVLDDWNLEEGTTYCGSPKKGDTNMTCIDKGMHSRESNYKDDESTVPIHITKGDIAHVSGDDRSSETQMKKSYRSGMRVDTKCPAVGPEALGLPGENLENITSQNEEKPSNNEAVEARPKRKRGSLTEERKAKRKKAKKRKRAQKEREQGVKRLKLQPISKPKTVKYCNFYLMGRCQQGDLCKFSHDTTPLTKSQPCTYFARDSCLKGDDCPFDHQLSKYPCHNFSSKGMCSRGDKCKFSHKITTNEASSSMPIISKSKSPLASEKLNFRRQNTTNGTSMVAYGPPKMTASSTPFPIQENMEGDIIKPPKIPMRIPNGIRFLSFGKGPSDSISKHQDNPLFKERKILGQQNQEKLLMDGHKNDTDDISSAQTSLLKVYSESNMMSGGAAHSAINTFVNKNLKNNSFSSVPSVVPGSRSLHSEVSDASKILEEFLFSGVS